MDYFSIEGLFQTSDHRVPVQTEHAIRGLMRPFESIFPNSRMPRDPQAALHCLDARKSLAQPIVPCAKKDWIEWIWWEVKLRLEMAVRFLNLEAQLRAHKSPPPIILFLREFRSVSHIETDGIGFDLMTGPQKGDVILREEIERTFPQSCIFWLANPRDALSYSFIRGVSHNSYPYIVSHDWLECVRTMAKSANLIVAANTGYPNRATNSNEGITREIELIREANLLDKSFFSYPNELQNSERIKNIQGLTSDVLDGSETGSFDDILKLPYFEHWAGPESSRYAAEYIAIIDRLWGDVLDTGRRVGGDVFAALFMAIGVLALFRGELAKAATLQAGLAAAMQSKPDHFLAMDLMAKDALQESAKWYADNAELFCNAYRIAFVEAP